MKKQLLLLVMMLLPMMAKAYDFELDGLYYNITSLQDLTVDVTYGDTPYSGEITLPSSVTYANKTFEVTGIAERCFANSQITAIHLPQSIKSLKIECFASCNELESLTIPGSVTSFERGVLLNCYKLNTLIIEDSENSLFFSRVTAYSNGYSPFRDCRLKSVYIGRTIESPSHNEQGLFHDQTSLNDVVLGENVQTIQMSMFYRCTALETIVLSKNIKKISYCAFYGCSSLKEVFLNEGLETIESQAFRGCKELESISLPSTLKSMSDNVFYEATKISSVICRALNPPTIYESTFSGITYLTALLHVPNGSESFYGEANGWKDFANISANISDNGLYRLTYYVDNYIYKECDLEEGTEIIPEEEPIKEGYTFSGWSEIPKSMPAHDVTVTGSFVKGSQPKCAKPTIKIVDGEVSFECETEGVTFKWYYSFNGGNAENAGNKVILGGKTKCHVTVYAAKDGYVDSDVAETDVELYVGKKGDTNGDGVVNVGDLVTTTNIIMGKDE